jgi:hypothetical protein
MRLRALVLSGLVLAACGAQPTPALQPTTPPSQPAATQPVAASLPDGVLLIFNREGGFAYTNLTLMITTEGFIRLEGDPQKGAVEWQASADQLASLNMLLNDPGFADLPYDPVVACMDCYIYTLTARTPQGVKAVKTDDADLSNNPPELLQRAVELLTGLMSSAP